ncbi:TetR/AcrR family transcriptional regulator [Amycolatopsis alkalitolerans]|uniref:TetR/AcrR family transcriptional regulator n=1 Tax=Amycolatopsis alkalitolerans TaxID=2547244 RepID=A0A5C4M0F2_9PSEU|nr:TetR/AcrR family transcriptional regulator [Amycolatopsis alkalitolerans]TNC25123.1 TetR/AcrR family transcriptional regulator [Amycolatopsis alkalitolerans]
MARRSVGIRRDSAETRDRLLDTAALLLAERGTAFTLPDLARAAGISSATVYRHFADVQEVHREFYYRLIDELVDDLGNVSARARGRRRFEAICDRWAACAALWGRAATHIRSAEGFLARVHHADPPTSTLFGILEPAIEEIIEDGTIPAQETDYAVLIWITIFDERVIVDLSETLRWSTKRIARTLSASVLGALGGDPAA